MQAVDILGYDAFQLAGAMQACGSCMASAGLDRADFRANLQKPGKTFPARLRR